MYAEDSYLRVGEVQKYLRLSRSSAYNLCNGRAFPVVRLGKVILVSKVVLNSYLESLQTGYGKN